MLGDPPVPRSRPPSVRTRRAALPPARRRRARRRGRLAAPCHSLRGGARLPGRRAARAPSATRPVSGPLSSRNPYARRAPSRRSSNIGRCSGAIWSRIVVGSGKLEVLPPVRGRVGRADQRADRRRELAGREPLEVVGADDAPSEAVEVVVERSGRGRHVTDLVERADRQRIDPGVAQRGRDAPTTLGALGRRRRGAFEQLHDLSCGSMPHSVVCTSRSPIGPTSLPCRTWCRIQPANRWRSVATTWSARPASSRPERSTACSARFLAIHSSRSVFQWSTTSR